MKINHKELIKTMDKFSRQRVLVMGDIMVDEYLWGSVERISPEAPVQIIEVKNQELRLGGCGNVVNNLCSFDARVSISSIVGDDENQKYLAKEMMRLGVDIRCLLKDPERPTTKKTRAIAAGQQIVRIDFEKRHLLTKKFEDQIIRFIRDNVSHFDIILFSDYGKGVLTKRVISSTIKIANEQSVPTVVDPKGRDFSKYSGASLITPNSSEAEISSHIEIKGNASAYKAAHEILVKGNHGAVLITRGKRGMTLLKQGKKEAIHIPTKAKEVFDVSGAGDTVLSVLSLGIAAGASYSEASYLANLAGGIVVGKLGTSAVTKDELFESLKKDYSNGS